MGGIDFDTCAGSLPRREGTLVLSPAEAASWLARGALLVDLREAYETNFRVFGAERVRYLPWTRFAAGFRDLPRDEALILADAAGIYGREAAALLRAAGRSNLAVLAGGMIEWVRDGLPVRADPAYELRGQCACRMRTRRGGNPLMARAEASSIPDPPPAES